MDAIDDWTRDCNNGSWNPYGGLDLATARAAARKEKLAIWNWRWIGPRRCCLIGGMAVSSPTSLRVFRIPANGFCEEKNRLD